MSYLSKFLAIASLAIFIGVIGINLNNNKITVDTNLRKNTKIDDLEIAKFSNSIVTNSKDRITYNNLFRSSLNGNPVAVKELINSWCGGGSRCYAHGVVIFKVVEQIGEEPFIKIIPSMSIDERLWLKALLEFGLEYAEFDEKYESITLEDKFPKISETLDYYTSNLLCFAIRRLHIPLCKN